MNLGGILIGVAGLVLPWPGWAQDLDISSGVVQLKDVLELAHRHNPEIQAARAEWEAAKQRIPQARSLPNPMAGVAMMPADAAIETRRGSIGRKYSVEQKVPFPGKLRLAGKVAKAEARAVRERYRGVELSVFAKVTAAFSGLFYIEQSIETDEEQADLIRHFSRVAERKYSIGGRSQSDVFRAQVEQAKIINDLITLRSDRVAARARLNALLNRAVDRPFGRPGGLEDLTFDFSQQELQAAAERYCPELSAQKATVEQRKAARALATLQFFPDLAFGYEHTAVNPLSSVPGADGQDARAFIVKLSVPLWIKSLLAQRSEADQRLVAARAAYRDIRNRTMAGVVDLAVAVENHLRLATLFKDTVIPLAEGTLASTQRGYEADRVNFLELLDSQRSFLKFKLEFHQHLADFATKRAELEKMIGISLEDLKGDSNER